MLQGRCSQQPLTLLSHSSSLQHIGVLGQDKALCIHLSWPPHAGVSCKYECWRALSASVDTKLNVVSPSHNLPIPAGSWDEQKHAGVRMCKVTLLNYFSPAACARAHKCSLCITHERSCGENGWRRGWGSCSPWLQCGQSRRHHGKSFVGEQLLHWCSEWRRTLTSGIPLLLGGSLPYSWLPLKRDKVKVQWVDWDGIKATAIAPFPQLPAAHETVLWKSLNSHSPILLIPTCISLVLLQHCSIISRDLVVLVFFSETLLSQHFQLNLGHQHNRLLFLHPKLLTSKLSTPHLWQFQGIGQHQTSGLETGFFHNIWLRLKGLHRGSKQSLAPLCQWQYSYASYRFPKPWAFKCKCATHCIKPLSQRFNTTVTHQMSEGHLPHLPLANASYVGVYCCTYGCYSQLSNSPFSFCSLPQKWPLPSISDARSSL